MVVQLALEKAGVSGWRTDAWRAAQTVVRTELTMAARSERKEEEPTAAKMAGK